MFFALLYIGRDRKPLGRVARRVTPHCKPKKKKNGDALFPLTGPRDTVSFSTCFPVASRWLCPGRRVS